MVRGGAVGDKGGETSHCGSSSRGIQLTFT